MRLSSELCKMGCGLVSEVNGGFTTQATHGGSTYNLSLAQDRSACNLAGGAYNKS